jgi:thiol-disulfide isomerase/thioredoxin
MKRFQGLRTTTAMLAAGMLAATLVTGCAGGGGQRQTETEAEQDGTTEAAAAGNAAGGESATLLAGLDGEVISGTGERTTLTEIAAGRPLVINFWTTWCPYCVEELPDFAQVVDEYGDRVEFAFVDIADGMQETMEDAKAWLDEHGFASLPAYYDTPETGLEVAKSFRVISIPVTVIVSPDGEVEERFVGKMDMDVLRQRLDAMV